MNDLTVPEKAINEIKEILAKHDLAGFVIVSSMDDVAYLRKIDPTWSCAWMEETGPDRQVTVRIRSKLEDYGGDKERQKREIEATTGMFLTFHGWAERTREQMSQVTRMFAKTFPMILHVEKLRRGTW